MQQRDRAGRHQLTRDERCGDLPDSRGEPCSAPAEACANRPQAYKSPENGWTNNKSKFVEGGQSRRLAKGDIIVIPPHLVHQWVTLDSDITHVIIQPDPKKELTIK